MFARLITWTISALALVGGGLMPATARAEPLIVEVRLNGVASDVLLFDKTRDVISAPPATLAALGIKGAEADKPVDLADLPGVSHHLDAQTQTLEITAPPEAMVSHRLSLLSGDAGPPERAAWGAALNYGLYGVVAEGQPAQLSLISEARLFGPAGMFSNSFTLRRARGDPAAGLRRLDTTYIRDDYARSRRLAVGDFVSASLPWTTPARAAGVSFSTDFSLRPDIITQPLPQLRGSSAAPSTVDVYMDGARRLTTQAPAGPFSVDAAPMVDGRGQVTMVVTDALGRQSTQTFAFYSASELLRGGTSAFAMEAGALRVDYGGDNDRYRDRFASGVGRRGFTDALTGEFRVGASSRVRNFGLGLSAKAGEVALFQAAFDVSDGPRRQGAQVYLAARRDTGAYSIFAMSRRRTGGYADFAVPDDHLARSESLAGASVQLKRWGALSATYSDIRTPGGGFQVANLSWSRALGQISLRGGALQTFGRKRATAISVGLAMPLGGGRFATASANRRGSTTRLGAEVSSPAVMGEGWGWRVLGEASQGSRDPGRLEAEARRETALGEVGLGVSRAGSTTAARAYGSGALVWMGGHVQAAAQIGDSFALIETGQPDIEIRVENRSVGHTDAKGRLLAVRLAPQIANRISVQAESVPLSDVIEAPEKAVRPPRGAGVVVSLPIRQSLAATLVLTDPAGEPLPPGLAVRVNGRESGVTGYDGEAFVTGLESRNTIEVIDKTGSCRLEVSHVPMSGALARLGPLACVPASPDLPDDRSRRVADSGPGGSELRRPDRSGGLRDLRAERIAGPGYERLRRGKVQLFGLRLHRLYVHYRDRFRGLGGDHRQTYAQVRPIVRGP